MILYALLAALFGVASGFQGVHERYGQDSFRAARTLFGLIYLASRGLIPALVFVGVNGRDVPLKESPVLQAISCGLSYEAILRLQFQVKEDLAVGLFSLVRWYQGLFLQQIARALAEKRKSMVKGVLPDEEFPAAYTRIRSNLGAWPTLEDRTAITAYLDEQDKRFRALGPSPDAVAGRQLKLEILYFVLNRIGEQGLQTLAKP